MPKAHTTDFHKKTGKRIFQYFNTNNLWFSLPAVKDLMMEDRLVMDPIDGARRTDGFVQLETPVGSAIQVCNAWRCVNAVSCGWRIHPVALCVCVCPCVNCASVVCQARMPACATPTVPAHQKHGRPAQCAVKPVPSQAWGVGVVLRASHLPLSVACSSSRVVSCPRQQVVKQRNEVVPAHHSCRKVGPRVCNHSQLPPPYPPHPRLARLGPPDRVW